MIRDNNFRPWGLLSKILAKLGIDSFAFLGSISTEDRSIAAFSHLHASDMTRERRFYLLEDSPSRFTAEVNSRLGLRRSELDRLRVGSEEIFTTPLLGLFGEIASDMDRFLESCRTRNIILDISGMPKKVFFHAIKILLGSESKFENVLVTYTDPAEYFDGPLAENPAPWHALPGFMPPRREPENRALIVGLGFEPLGLLELYNSGHFSTPETHLLLPVTGAQQHVARNWDFVRMLESEAGSVSTIHRIDARNVPDVFDNLSKITRRGEIYSILAPYGPKPVSLAMCLFACASRQSDYPSSVFYTQPSIYNPNYSTGVGIVGGLMATHTYCIRLNSCNLYNL